MWHFSLQKTLTVLMKLILPMVFLLQKAIALKDKPLHHHILMFSFFADQSSGPQLDDEDLEQLDQDNLEEMDIKWQVAMLSMRVKHFYKKTGRKLIFNGKEPVGMEMHWLEQGQHQKNCTSRDTLMQLVVMTMLGDKDKGTEKKSGGTRKKTFAMKRAVAQDDEESVNPEILSTNSHFIYGWYTYANQYDSGEEVPSDKDLLEKMLNLQLEAEEESTMAFELLKFIKSQIKEQ
ncbi:hypothetical protein Tco_1300830 [Tanacetum coccineum]